MTWLASAKVAFSSMEVNPKSNSVVAPPTALRRSSATKTTDPKIINDREEKKKLERKLLIMQLVIKCADVRYKLYERA